MSKIRALSVAEIRQCFATLLRTAFGSSHVSRWRQSTRLDQDWNERTAMIASLIEDKSTVLEFGAGSQMLRTALPDSCTYIASDIVARNEQTVVCDLNAASFPDIPRHDVAVFSGVLEYIFDVGRVIQHLSQTTKVIVVSYAPCTERTLSNRYRRLVNGWVNAYGKPEFEQVFQDCGYRSDRELKWQNQYIWRFRRQEPS